MTHRYSKLAARIVAGCVFLGSAIASISHAQEKYPAKPITLVVPYAAGGTTDIIARLLGKEMTDKTGVAVVIDNRPGANTNIGAEWVARAKPDGYTLLFGTGGQVINPIFGPYPSIPLGEALDPVSLVSSQAFVIAARPNAPFNTAKDYLEEVKKKPGKYSISSAQLDLYVALVKKAAGINILHVPYKGGAPSLLAVMSGEVDTGFTLVPAGISHFKAGKLKPIAVTTKDRQESLPDTAALSEAGVNIDLSSWYGLFVPKGTPKSIVNDLATLTKDIMSQDRIKKQLQEMGAASKWSTPGELRDAMSAEKKQWEQLAKDSPDLVRPK
ncbi:Bug family tripartite tricarboxylate transporter substrate binding protein [Ottowia sp. VDI28]|uniref:Bug family tripartite tricarboxylate transporter substrate binding protein n=1 Tax=Ottowia sp. VDI28 TaxID=3133968 RepID=UPI003C2E5EA2